jgi:hypothetical protein
MQTIQDRIIFWAARCHLRFVSTRYWLVRAHIGPFLNKEGPRDTATYTGPDGGVVRPAKAATKEKTVIYWNCHRQCARAAMAGEMGSNEGGIGEHG